MRGWLCMRSHTAHPPHMLTHWPHTLSWTSGPKVGTSHWSLTLSPRFSWAFPASQPATTPAASGPRPWDCKSPERDCLACPLPPSRQAQANDVVAGGEALGRRPWLPEPSCGTKRLLGGTEACSGDTGLGDHGCLLGSEEAPEAVGRRRHKLSPAFSSQMPVPKGLEASGRPCLTVLGLTTPGGRLTAERDAARGSSTPPHWEA